MIDNVVMPSSEKSFVKVASLQHGLAILRLLARTDQPLGVTAIARALSLSPSSCFNLLKTLCSEGMTEFHPVAKTYQIGDAVAEFVGRGHPDGVPAVVRPRLEALAAQHRVASGLWRIVGVRLVLLHFVASETATSIHMSVGQRLPLFIGAMGRCVAAHSALAHGQLEAEVSSLRWARAPGRMRYRREVAHVRRHGWALDDGDFMRGICTVAAPVLDRSGDIRYCIANSFFQGEHDAAAVARIGAITAQCGKNVSALI